ncbi:MAG: sigma 54-interacting transcriptional regulator, partial [Desulfotignum sp.]
MSQDGLEGHFSGECWFSLSSAKAEHLQYPELIGVFEQIQALATNDYPVQITGETGTGKEMVAAALHNESR